MTQLPHLRLDNTATSLPYSYAGPKPQNVLFNLPPRDRVGHADRLKNELQSAVSQADTLRANEAIDSTEEGLVLTFRSDKGFELQLTSLDRPREGFQLLSYNIDDGVVCMAVTTDDRDVGCPSAWSAAIDQMISGSLDENPKLMFISAGNVRGEMYTPTYTYPNWNCKNAGVEDPAQSWNAITVGAYTDMITVRDPELRGWNPIAIAGDLCPTSRTSLPWPEDSQHEWPIKPDIVMEGGNYVQDGGSNRRDSDDLSILTTALTRDGRLFQTTRDTSPATAAAARMAAIIWSYYPKLKPETIRGLMIHSAQWTNAMEQRFPGGSKTAIHSRLRCYGYGVPDLGRALWSAQNAATLIFEGELQPYHVVGSDVKTKDMHFHHLPWPTEVLRSLGDTDVTMHVTLSYYIEPSPGRRWTQKHRYQSHGLRFDVIRGPYETPENFRKRISAAEWTDPHSPPDNVQETRNWMIGNRGRRYGSIHSDWWTGSATELSSCNYLAVYPVTGWWRERHHLDKWGNKARYSLIVSIETADQKAQLYAGIANQAMISPEVIVSA